MCIVKLEDLTISHRRPMKFHQKCHPVFFSCETVMRPCYELGWISNPVQQFTIFSSPTSGLKTHEVGLVLLVVCWALVVVVLVLGLFGIFVYLVFF